LDILNRRICLIRNLTEWVRSLHRRWQTVIGGHKTVICSLSTMTARSGINEDESGERPGTTRQKQRDRNELRQRCSCCPRAAFERMEIALRGQSKSRLVREGLSRSRETKCPRPDRLCRRQRVALICWFCEFWSSRAGPIAADTPDIDWMTSDLVDDEWSDTYEDS
jgi:hypothetical protein